MTQSFMSLAHDVLLTANATEKAEKSREAAHVWRTGAITVMGEPLTIERPARPSKPELLSPAHMPKRTAGHHIQNRINLLHALAHIELNAIDLAWDIMARFCVYKGNPMPKEFFDDWVQVADEEAKHFLLVENRLNELGAAYGDLPAHDGLWESAERTKDNLAARLAVVPMVLEARGLDVTPNMIKNLAANGDTESSRILQIIHDEEIGHVAFGKRWFEYIAGLENKEPQSYWQDLVGQYFKGNLHKPFNTISRDKANFPQCWYEPLAV